MTPAQVSLLADSALAAIAAGSGIPAQMIREARDDASAPHAEIPAVALRRVWLWAVASACPTKAAAARACGVHASSIRRAVNAVEVWRETDSRLADASDPVIEFAEAMAATISESSRIQRLATFAAIKDRQRLDAARRHRRATRKRESNGVILALAREARAAGADARADRFAALAIIPRPKPVRSRDLHRARAGAPSL